MNRGNRRQGREMALQIIYGLQDQNCGIQALLSMFWENFSLNDDVLGDYAEDVGAVAPHKARCFAEELAVGVAERLSEVDARIQAFSTNWTIERMARVDLALLRLAVYEIVFCPDVPASVVINEAIEIGKRFGAKETPAFINGILDKIASEARPAGEKPD